MKNLAGLWVLALVFLVSCQKKTDLSSLVPNDAVAVGKINLPAIKSKIMTWEQIKKYLFSTDQGDQQLDWSIDLDRQIVFCALDERNAQLIVPILDNQTFKNAAQQTFHHQIQTKNGFEYLQSEKFTVGWKSDFAIFSFTDDFLNSSQIGSNARSKKILDATHDVYVLLEDSTHFDQLVSLEWKTNFGEGSFQMNLLGNQALASGLDTLYSPDVPLERFAFPTEGALATLNTQMKPKYLLYLIHKAMPYLQQNGILFQDQLESLSPYLDGRICLSVSEPNDAKTDRPQAKIAFGTGDGFEAYFKNELVNGLVLDAATGYYPDKEDFQFFKSNDRHVIYSTFNEPNTAFTKQGSLFHLQLNRAALDEQLLILPKMFFGHQAVDQFPIKEVEVEVHPLDKKMEANLRFGFQNQAQNSLLSLLDYTLAVFQKEEI